VRVLILTQYFPPEVGDSQIRLSAFSRELKRLGHEAEGDAPHYRSPRGGGPALLQPQDARGDQLVVEPVLGSIHGSGRETDPYGGGRAAQRLARILLEAGS